MFGGPRGSKGKYDKGALSGTTYGGQGLGWFWQGYPNIIGGLTEYNPGSTMPGSNISAVEADAANVARDAGEPSADTSGYSQGGTAAY
jgi:hypothetical protein